MHGFLLLRSEEGKVVAAGDLINVAHGTRVRSRLVFRFRDGSIDEETTVFNQGTMLELVSDHHIQKGPSFPKPLDMAVDVSAGQVMWRENKDGHMEARTERMSLPADLSNGLIPQILENLPRSATEQRVTYLAATPKPRVVTLSIRPGGRDGFTVGHLRHTANRYRIHVDLGGAAAVIAPVIGKQPSDITVWVAAGEVQSFVKLVGALYLGGPTWTMELSSPVWR